MADLIWIHKILHIDNSECQHHIAMTQHAGLICADSKQTKKYWITTVCPQNAGKPPCNVCVKNYITLTFQFKCIY